MPRSRVLSLSLPSIHLLYDGPSLPFLRRNIVQSLSDVEEDGEDPLQHDRGARRQQAGEGQGQELLPLGLGHQDHLVQPDVEDAAWKKTKF